MSWFHSQEIKDRRVPIFLNESQPGRNDYRPRVWRLLNTTDDSEDFVDFQAERSSELIPVLEAKSIHQFDHRFATFSGGVSDDQDNGGEFVEVNNELKENPDFAVYAQHYVTENFFLKRLPEEFRDKRWFLTARNIARSTDERTVIGAIIPRSASCEVTPYIEVVGGALASTFLTSALNSYVLDYVARQKVGGTHLSYFILYQFPILFPPMDHRLALPFIVPRVLELTYTAHDLRGFAEDCGYTCEPFIWNEERRFLLRCELDAAFFHLYGINRSDATWILRTFPIAKRKNIQRYGRLRTKRVILEIYDEMQRAIETGATYQTRLDPPPANGWVPPVLPKEEVPAKSDSPPAMPADEKQSDLFPWQVQDPQQALKFDDEG